MKFLEVVKKIGLLVPAGVMFACVVSALGNYEAPAYESMIPEELELPEDVTAQQEEKKEEKEEKKTAQLPVHRDENQDHTVYAATRTSHKKAKKLPPVEDTGVLYKDGTYMGTAEGYGGRMEIQVVVEAGKIASVKVLDNQETPEFLQQALILCDRIVSAQSTSVDAVSGATFSSNGIISGTRDALSSAVTEEGAKSLIQEEKSSLKKPDKSASKKKVEKKKKKKSSADTGKVSTDDNYYYKDGTYTGTGSGFSGDVTVSVKIKDGRIVSVKVTESVDDEFYLSQAKKLLTQIASAQNTDVDAVSGATYSSNGILEATANALTYAVEKKTDTKAESDESEKAGQDASDADSSSDSAGTGSEDIFSEEGEGEEESASSPKDYLYADGTYHGSAVCEPDESWDFDSYTLQLDLTVRDGAVTEIANVAGTGEWYAPTNNGFIRSAANGNSQVEGMIAKILGLGVLESTDTLNQVDAVSGATCSSWAIIDACREALTQAAQVKEQEMKKAIEDEDPISSVPQIEEIESTEDGQDEQDTEDRDSMLLSGLSSLMNQ